MSTSLVSLALLAQAGSAAPHAGWLTRTLLEFARGGAEWVLWLLVALSLGSFAVLIERLLFFRRVGTNAQSIRSLLMTRLPKGDIDGTLSTLNGDDSMAARVVSNGLRDAERGPEAVEELCRGAIGMERLRYEKNLTFLATVGSNAPFIGLFGTVMGVIMAFDGLRGLQAGGAAGAQDPAQLVMGAIAEALIATGVGLLVAIPAILFFNVLKGRVKKTAAETELLVQTMIAYLRSPRTPGA